MMRNLCPLLAAALLVLLGTGAASAFDVGFNQAWIGEAYGHDFTHSWNANEVDLDLIRAKGAGAAALRLWLFEGMEKDGVTFNGTRATGLAPGFLDHVEETCRLARARGVKIYWTGLSGNWTWPRATRWSFIHYNILNDRFGEGQSFRYRALGPVLDVLARYRDTVYAFDVMNEVEGALSGWWWPTGWTGARKWIQAETAFVHARLPGVPVTASTGWHTAPDDLASGKLSGLGLDFYDLHVYNDAGTIPRALPLRLLSWRTATPILLGEYGQAATRADDALQTRVTAGFLKSAAQQSFLGAFAWRLDDERPSVPGYPAQHSYLRQDQPRPAYYEVQRFSAALADGTSPWTYVLGLIR